MVGVADIHQNTCRIGGTLLLDQRRQPRKAAAFRKMYGCTGLPCRIRYEISMGSQVGVKIVVMQKCDGTSLCHC